jgi:hypothetical protein
MIQCNSREGRDRNLLNRKEALIYCSEIHTYMLSALNSSKVTECEREDEEEETGKRNKNLFQNSCAREYDIIEGKST